MKNKFKLSASISLLLAGISLFFASPIAVAAAEVSSIAQVANYEDLVSAIENDKIEEIVITNTITLPNEANLDGKNKIFRAEVTRVNEQGIVKAEDSKERKYSLFTNGTSSTYDTPNTATMKNMKIYGGLTTAIANNTDDFLTLENVMITRSGNPIAAAGGISNAGTLIMKNCSVVRNVAKNGGGIVSSGLLVLDGCSLTENRSLGSSGGGGALEIKSSSIMVANNTVFANNTSSEIGGAINIYNSTVYLLNSTVVGNATTRPDNRGGGVGVNGGTLYAVNSIFTDNYAFNNQLSSPPIESDISSYNYSTSNIYLYNSIYKTIANAQLSSASSDNYALSQLSSVEGIFTSYQTSGILEGDGNSKTEVFQKPIVTSLPDGRLYAPVNDDCDLVKNGVDTFLDYSMLYDGSKQLGVSFMKDGVNTPLGKFSVSENKVNTYINGEERISSTIGAANSSTTLYKTIKASNGNASAGSISGATVYGDSYEKGTPVTVKAIANDGYAFDAWQDEYGNYLSSDEVYTFEVVKDLTLSPKWVSTANPGNVVVSNLTCNPVVYLNSRSIKLNNLVLEKGLKIEGLYLNDVLVADENLLLKPNIEGVTNSDGQWIATSNVTLRAEIVDNRLVIDNTTGYVGIYDGEEHQIKVEASSPTEISYKWYFDGKFIEGAVSETLSVENVLDSGEYYCLVSSIINDEEVSIWTNPITVHITPIKISALEAVGSYIYNGTEQTVEIEGFESYMTVTGDKATNVGQYEAVITLDSNHAWEEGSNGIVIWEIQKATVNTSNAQWNSENLQYTGEEQEVFLEGIEFPSDVEVIYTGNKGINVGDYTATVSFNYDTNNYNTISVANPTHVWEISACEITVVWENDDYTYTGSELELPTAYIYNANLEEKIYLQVSMDKALFKDAGTYVFTATDTSGNYELLGNTTTVVVNPYELIVSWEYENSYVYTGSNLELPTASITTLEGEEVELVVQIETGNEVFKNAGNYTFITTYNSNNYVITNEVSKEVEILKATFDMSNAKWNYETPFTYDGIEKAVFVTGLPTGVTVASYEGDFTGTNADTYTAKVVLSYDLENYNEISIDDLVWKINPKEVSVVWENDDDQTYTGLEIELPTAYIYDGNLDENIYLNVSLDKEAFKNAGTYLFTATDISGNYQLLGNTTSVVVNPKEVGLTWDNLVLIYNGKGQLPTVIATGLVDGDVCTVTVDGSKINVGNYTATATSLSNANYKLPAQVTTEFVIEKATFDMSNAKWDYENAFTYDGTEKAVTVIGLPDGVKVEYTGNTAINAGESYTASADLIYDSSNYYEISMDDLVWKINPKEVGLTWDNLVLIYNSKGQLPTATATGLVDGDVCTVTVDGLQTNVGNYTATATSLSNANYKLPAQVTTEFVIEKATFDMSNVKWDYEDAFTYDGTEKVVTVIGLPTGIAVEYTGNKATGAGTYTASVVLSYDSENYNDITVADLVWEINPKEVSVVWENTDNQTYTGNKLVYPTASIETVDGTVELTPVIISGGDEFINVSTYKFEVSYDNPNYIITNEVSKEIKILKDSFDMSEVKWDYEDAFTYDGTEKVVTVIGLPTGIAVEYTGNKATGAGTYTASVVLSYDSENYNDITVADLVWEINPKEVGLTWGELVFTYDGESKLPTVTATGLVDGDQVTVTVDGSQTNVGNYTATATALSNANYKLPAEVTKSFVIEKAQLTITVKNEEVTYGDTKPSYTVSYNGFVNNETENVLSGELSYTCVYTEKTSVGNYTISVTGLTADNYEIIYVSGNIKVNQKEVGLTWGELVFTYDGESKLPTVTATGLLNGDQVTVIVDGSQTNVGNYTATATGLSSANYKLPAEVTKSFVIEKATYNMSGISFDGKTVPEDGQNHALTITGTLPTGVSVSYSLTECTEPGIYEITATFSGDYNNYNLIPDMKATLIIEQSILKGETNLGEDHENDVLVSSPDGIDPNKQLVVELVEIVKNEKDYAEYLEDNQKAGIAYEIKLVDKDGAEVQPDGTLVIRILIPEELRNVEFDIIHIHDGEQIPVNYTRDGDYVVISTNQLSEFVFVYEVESLAWIIIVLGVVDILEAALLVLMMNKKKQYGKVTKLASVYLPYVFGVFVQEWQLIVLIILAVAVVALAAADVVYANGLLALKKKAASENVVKEETSVLETPTEETPVEQPEESEEETKDEDVIKVWDEINHSYKEVRIIKGFAAKLTLSTDEYKNYYDIVKNELLSYKNVKSKISFKHETFKIGKEISAKLMFRGKTLCLYLASNPADYENTKYKVEDMSTVSHSVDVPTMYRVNLPRRANYAKELIADLMGKLNVEKMDKEYVRYSESYPYEDVESLIEKGLIKKLIKKEAIEIKN